MKKLTVVLTVLFSISLFVFTSCGQYFVIDDLLTYDWFEGTWEGTVTGSQEYVFSNLTTEGEKYVAKYKEDFDKTEADYSMKIEVVNENVIWYDSVYNEETDISEEKESKENKKLMKITISTPNGPETGYYDIREFDLFGSYGHKLENNEPVYNFYESFISPYAYFPEIGDLLGSGSSEWDARTNPANTKIKIQSSSELESNFGDGENEYGDYKFYYSVNMELERL
ncbi:MAG: hypothetical protein J6K22_02050 [Spirochaetaceae bacterium]|nr:hypothetical protein [Spirochaetaceae bacterium]